MFRDNAQLARACLALLADVHLDRLWTNDGPTAEAVALLERDGDPLTGSERIVVLAVWSLWNGRGGLELADILAELDERRTVAVFELVIAAKRGDELVDAWLARHEPGSGSLPKLAPKT